DARRIGADGLHGHSGAKPVPLVSRDHHKERRREADEGVRTETRGASVEAALKADQAARNPCRTQVDADLDEVLVHACLARVERRPVARRAERVACFVRAASIASAGAAVMGTTRMPAASSLSRAAYVGAVRR